MDKLLNITRLVNELVEKKRYTQVEIADKLGKTVQTVRNYLSGRTKIDIETLFDIAKALEVPMTYFFEEYPGENKGIVNESEIKYNIKTSETDRLLAEKDERIADLKQTIEILKKQLEKQNGVTKNDYAKNI